MLALVIPYFSRSTEINTAIRQQNRETIKKGNLSPSDIPSQEWLVKGRQEVYSKSENKRTPDLPYYFFTFNANEATGSLTISKLDIIMNNRNKFTSYSEAQIVEIWDRIISSLRYKPNAF
ncbi:T6SS immunity protein Tli4 family protein [Providencia rustigianii]|uniref:T6SS immunity protein Tli4 family protein n=1 Tax=Providencia rustigianii TaxID=158850 RepID=UPI001E45BAB5|nr:T6SS immunity protein Tli4 family protein [Providencia rustigianii]